MAVYNIPITKAYTGQVVGSDRLLSFEEYGVKKLDVVTTAVVNISNIRVDAPGRVLEFPAIGASLPSAFDLEYVTEGSVISVRVVEYGNQPDPDYFNITGVDDFGKPLYGESKGAEQKA